MRPALALLIVLLLGACARVTNPAQPTLGPSTSGQTLYEATTTVLEDQSHGPELCLGGVLDSLPPQCGIVPVPNWDWDEVEGEERLGETIWGDYRVVGTFDGETFTVTEVYGPRFPGGAPEDGIETPCPEPEGGWRAVDPTRASESDMQAAMRAARSEPDFSGFWIEYIDEVAAEDAAYANPDTDPELVEEGLGGGNIIVNVAFTGDLAVHERETRALWGGALCMVQHERTLDELEDIQRDLDGTVEDLDLVFLSSGIDETRNVVELEVAVLSEETMQELDARYGEGAVRASGVLQPVR